MERDRTRADLLSHDSGGRLTNTNKGSASTEPFCVAFMPRSDLSILKPFQDFRMIISLFLLEYPYRLELCDTSAAEESGEDGADKDDRSRDHEPDGIGREVILSDAESRKTYEDRAACESDVQQDTDDDADHDSRDVRHESSSDKFARCVAECLGDT